MASRSRPRRREASGRGIRSACASDSLARRRPSRRRRWRLGILLEHRAFELARVSRESPERPHPGEQLVEHHPQRVDIGGHRHRSAANLLGAGVGRRQGAQLRLGRRGVTRFGVDQLRDPEIQQSRPAVRSDQDIARLEVAMHDVASVRVLDRFQHLEEETQPVVDREPALPGVSEKIDTFDVLEDEVSAAVGGAATVEKSRDPGMLERRQEFHFVAKAALRERRGLSTIQPFDRHLAQEALSALLGEIDPPHAAVRSRARSGTARSCRAGPERRRTPRGRTASVRERNPRERRSAATR